MCEWLVSLFLSITGDGVIMGMVAAAAIYVTREQIKQSRDAATAKWRGEHLADAVGCLITLSNGMDDDEYWLSDRAVGDLVATTTKKIELVGGEKVRGKSKDFGNWIKSTMNRNSAEIWSDIGQATINQFSDAIRKEYRANAGIKKAKGDSQWFGPIKPAPTDVIDERPT